jgi:hypothetical protein
MPSISSFALIASIVASVMGALVVCVLVFRYGFTIPAPSDADAGPSPADVLTTRIGHAVAAACFAATGVLAVVALSLQAPQRAPTVGTTASVSTPTRAVSAKAERAEADLVTLRQRLAAAEAELVRLDGEFRSAPPPNIAGAERSPTRARADARPRRPDAMPTAAPDPSRGHTHQLLANTRKAWEFSRDRAVDFAGDVRTVWVRVERAVVRRVSTDLDRSSSRD